MNNQGEFNFTDLVQETVERYWPARQRLATSVLRQARPAHAEIKRQGSTSQSILNFAGLELEKGYSEWLAGRRLAAEELARRLHLPLGHRVEVWLSSGIRLRGKLRLTEEVLLIEEERLRHLELMVDEVAFTYREMESCVRID